MERVTGDEPPPGLGAAGLCVLHYSAGEAASCPGAACAFWAPGAREAASGCALERIGPELLLRPELARHLLELRSLVETERRLSA